MLDAEEDPFKEILTDAAGQVDIESARSADENSHPLLRLFQRELSAGATTEEAVERTVERLSTVGQQVLGILDFPPRALDTYPLVKKMESQGITKDEGNTAVHYLMQSGQVDEINGWYFRKPEPLIKVEELTADDMQWLAGTGRYGQ